jgi:hypothetical protein
VLSRANARSISWSQFGDAAGGQRPSLDAFITQAVLDHRPIDRYAMEIWSDSALNDGFAQTPGDQRLRYSAGWISSPGHALAAIQIEDELLLERPTPTQSRPAPCR